MLKKIAGAMTGLVAAVTVASITATPAYASGIFQFHNWGVGTCLDSNSGGSAYAQGCNGGNNQRWSLWDNNGSYLFKDTATGRFLCEDENWNYGQLYTVNNGCWSGDAGNWTLVSVNGYYQIKSVQTGDCVGVLPGGGLGTDSCSGQPYMLWWRSS